MTLEQPPWLWLCVVPDPPPSGQTGTSRTLVKGREEPSPADDNRFWLGVSDPAKDRRSNSAADRVAALLPHGTTPESKMPVLTRSLTESIWVAFTSKRKGQLPAAAPAHLLQFLRSHLGGIAFVRKAVGPDTGDYDEELRSLMRASFAQAQRTTSQPLGMRVTRVTAMRGYDEPGDGGLGGVREPRNPLPDAAPTAAALDPAEDQP